MREEPRITDLAVSAYRIATDQPESDGTLEWRSTTLVVVEAHAGDEHGLGYTYADRATAVLVRDRLRPLVVGRGAFEGPAVWQAMVNALRNLGASGVGATAVSAVDAALWDLKARLLGVPLASLVGLARPAIPVYGSGGFTSLSVLELQRQLAGWAEAGFGSVKMKVGRDPSRDPERVRAAREAIGVGVELYVDANGAYRPKQALALARVFAPLGVTWLEEPVPQRDLDTLALIREAAPPTIDVVAGEYGWESGDFLPLLGAVDVLQADATRCGGITGFLRVAALCEAHRVPLSSHTAPSLHVALCCATPAARNLEWFHDHVGIEAMLFDGAPAPRNGLLAPDLSRPGIGLELKRREADRHAA